MLAALLFCIICIRLSKFTMGRTNKCVFMKNECPILNHNISNMLDQSEYKFIWFRGRDWTVKPNGFKRKKMCAIFISQKSFNHILSLKDVSLFIQIDTAHLCAGKRQSFEFQEIPYFCFSLCSIFKYHPTYSKHLPKHM